MEGAIRETREEANVDVEVISPFAQLDIPLIGQIFGHDYGILARLKKPHFSLGPESSECQLFSLNEIPYTHHCCKIDGQWQQERHVPVA
ncbi:hypothetical protein JHK85_004649 [Glycine max]|nr:hypothetical protein JHK85_004649 [Glycine max]